MNILFIGVQGSGKGTQAKRVADKLGLCHISTGDLLRNATGKLKEQVKKEMDAGHLIHDALMMKILRKRITKPDCGNGIILDGFPRTLSQAKLLDKHITIDAVLEISISRSESRKRLSGRVHCSKCGHNYNLNTSPKPKKKGICDIDGSSLVQRSDDNSRAINKRIKTYYEQTEPVLEHHYEGQVIKVNGEQSISKITNEIVRKLKKL